MRKQDLQKFDVVYTEGPEADDHRFAKAIGVNLPSIRSLRAEIFEDFDEKHYGISWWKGYPDLGFKERILISDQLWQSLSSVQENVIEAQLHLMALVDLWDHEDRSMKNAVHIIDGEPHLDIPKRISPKDELPAHLASLHLKGLLGSLSSSVDCLAAGVIGVMGIRLKLIEAGYSGLKKHFRENFDYATELQQAIPTKLNKIESAAGPSGWLQWLMDYRNMALHRGRRIRLSQVLPRAAGIIAPTGAEIVRTDVVQVLVRNPAVSEIESLKDGSLEPLSEPAELTFNELIRSTTFFIEEVAKLMSANWKTRRANPEVIQQPSKQWPMIRPGDHRAFGGYQPGTLSVNFGKSYTSEAMVKRMRAASLAGSDIENWKKE